MTRLPGIVGLVLLAVLTACADSEGAGGSDAPPAPLEDTSWILTQVSLDGELTPAVDSSGSLNLAADGTMFGSTGCNRFSGTWTAAGGALTLQTGPMTLMACPADLQAQELAVLAGLAATSSYTVDGETLTLSDAGDNVVATYTAAVTDLAGTAWQATGINNGAGAVVTTQTTAALTLRFGDDGTVSGFDGCGDFTGAYTADDPALSFSALQPAPACESAEQAQYLAALDAVTAYRVDGDRLELRDDAGALQAGYTAAG